MTTATANRPLFEITAEMMKLDALLEEIEGDLSRLGEAEAAMAALMESLSTEQGAKIDAYVNLIRVREARAAVRREEAERYLAGAKADENCAKWLKDMLKNNLEMTGQLKIETPTGRVVAVQKNGGKLPVVLAEGLEPKDVPERFARITKEFDRDAIRTHLESHGDLSFARLGERGTTLRIK